jgi:chitin disaccharide deacetylase
MNEPAYLIVNADDYGYFTSVSRGILDGGKDGLITATGIIANSRYFDEHIQWLKDATYLDAGVHLNLTYGKPLTEQMTRRLVRWQGEFPGKYSLILGRILTRQLPMDCVVEEWRAQIQRCRDACIEVYFLNTHEHLHALPPLFTAILKLAEENNIPYLRCPEPEWDAWRGIEGMARNSLLQIMHLINRARMPKKTPKLLGMNDSGNLTLFYLKKRLASLQRGQVYELMCHPGYFDPEEIRDLRLCSYHHWQQELDLLRSQELRNLCDSFGIQVIRYKDLYEKN